MLDTFGELAFIEKSFREWAFTLPSYLWLAILAPWKSKNCFSFKLSNKPRRQTLLKLNISNKESFFVVLVQDLY